MVRFADRHLAQGDTLVQPGEVSNLLAVIMSGRLLFEHRPKAGQEPRLFELYPGQFVAVTSAFHGMPSRMRIFATEDTDLLILGHRELAELLRDYPALRSITGRLQTVARALDRDVFCGSTGSPGL
jgi:CRP-like cAMP-binding protein